MGILKCQCLFKFSYSRVCKTENFAAHVIGGILYILKIHYCNVVDRLSCLTNRFALILG